MYLRRNVLESCKAKKCIKVPAQSHVIERGSLSRGKVWMMMTVLRGRRNRNGRGCHRLNDMDREACFTYRNESRKKSIVRQEQGGIH